MENKSDIESKIKALDEEFASTSKKYNEDKKFIINNQNDAKARLDGMALEIERTKRAYAKAKTAYDSIQNRANVIKAEIENFEEQLQTLDTNYDNQSKEYSEKKSELENQIKALDKALVDLITEKVINNMDVFKENLRKAMQIGVVTDESYIFVDVTDYNTLDSYLRQANKYCVVGYKLPDKDVTDYKGKFKEDYVRLIRASLDMAKVALNKKTIMTTIKAIKQDTKDFSTRQDAIICYHKDDDYVADVILGDMTDDDIQGIWTNVDNRKRTTKDGKQVELWGACAKYSVAYLNKGVVRLPSEAPRSIFYNIQDLVANKGYYFVLKEV